MDERRSRQHHSRQPVNPVATKMLGYLVSPTNDVSNGSANFFNTAEITTAP
jgi:hypothetical protein